MHELLPSVRSDLVARIQAVMAERPRDRVQACLDAWRRRFPLDRLAALSGAELLYELHERGRDSMAYWLERKTDDDFQTRWFGSIQGGSALKFVVFQSDDDLWYGGHPRDIRQLTIDEAAAIATGQRDELLAALDVLRALPDDPDDPAWDGLAARVAAAAPLYGHLAFFHKALCLYAPTCVDDFHSDAYQVSALVGCGLPVADGGLFANARTFARLRKALSPQDEGQDVEMVWLTSAMSLRTGPPVSVWRIGAGNDRYDAWPDMHKQKVAAIGWSELGDLQELLGDSSGHAAIRVLRDALHTQWPDQTPQQAGKDARQLYRFVRKMAHGDLVVVARGLTVLGIGRIAGDYQYIEGAPYAHQRRVEWLHDQPWKTPDRGGLQTTVYDLSTVYDYQTALHRQLAQGAATGPETPRPRPIGRIVQAMLAQLERKGQVLVYGPPGTGKTFHAIQAAEELVADASHGRAWAQLLGAERAALKAPGAGQRIWTATFHPAYGYEDFVEGLHPEPVPGGLQFTPRPGLFRVICQRAEAHPDERFVLVVDEFNRGDAARIFGELLTLLELDKRERVHVVLPHSRHSFTVPRNVRLVATMNTSDRSIALLDAALQRRFGKLELLPDPSVLGEHEVAGISLAGLLDTVNARLLETLGDRARDLQVGHAYFMRDGRPVSSLTGLRDVVVHDLLPLLQDYCADDPRALQQLVGEALYDLDRRRFRAAPLAPGGEDLLVEALLSWGDAVAAVGAAADTDALDDTDDPAADSSATDEPATAQPGAT